ncbi:hypothetical protein D3Y55_20245 [Mesorhizobium sp. DCY119]|nr:hypothetical protein D3Y55_20245 [Mesorhizobium sp. DCY119]
MPCPSSPPSRSAPASCAPTRRPWRRWRFCRRRSATGEQALRELYSAGRLTRFAALPVLTDQNVRSAPVLANHARRLCAASSRSTCINAAHRW